MPGPENKSELIHADEIEATELPVRITEGKDTVIVHKNDTGTIFMRHWHEEQSVVSVAITSEQVHIIFADGTQILHPRNNVNESSPFPLQGELQSQFQSGQQPAEEKEGTISVTGSFVKEISYHKVNGKNKKTQQPEKLWLHKFFLLAPGEAPDTTRKQIVTSMGDAAERHKKMGLQPGEKITVRGYVQDRTNTKTGEKTMELFAFTVRRMKPQKEQADA